MSSKKHILVVEDERHLAIGIRYNLEAEGYRVSTAEDGPTALQLLQAGTDPIDLVVLDLMLPGMSGYHVCESMRNAGNDKPVLMLTARTLTEDRTRGFDAGADQYLNKPFDLDELLSRVKSLLSLYERRVERREREPAAPEDQVYTFGQARVDFRSYEVLVSGRPARLTQLEMKLLQYFVDNPGRVIPRHELLEKVWDTAGHVSTRAVDQFLLRLRKIFEENPSEPQHFLTIRDAGYRFVPAEPSETAKDPEPDTSSLS